MKRARCLGTKFKGETIMQAHSNMDITHDNFLYSSYCMHLHATVSSVKPRKPNMDGLSLKGFQKTL